MNEFIYPKVTDTGEARQRAKHRINQTLEHLPTGKAYRIVVKEVRASRTNLQNNYLFGVAYPLIAEATGYLVDDIHDELCMRHFGRKAIRVPRHPDNPGGIKYVPTRTTTVDTMGKHDVLETTKFWEFVETVQNLGAELGVIIPDPDPVLRKTR